MDRPCPESKEGYQPVRRMLLEKLDDAQPMSKLIRESKRKTGKPLPSELLNILSMPTTSFGGGVILYSVRSSHTTILVRKDGTVAIINFQQAILTAHDKFGGDRYSSILRHWPLEACIYGYSWNVIENDRRRVYCNETSWREWVPRRGQTNPDLAALWLLRTYYGDLNYAPPPQHWLDDKDHEKQSKEILTALEGCGRKTREQVDEELRVVR